MEDPLNRYLTKDYRSDYSKYRLNYNVKQCRKLGEVEVKRIKTKDAREKLKWLKKELSKLDLPKSLPKGICHCDFHFSNVLFNKGKFNALIDFDDANYTYLTYDLICLIKPFIPKFNHNTWNKFKKESRVFDFKQAKKVISEYTKYKKLNSNEEHHLFDVYKLSILIDCIWYFKRGKAKDFYEKRKIDYLNALGREGFYDGLFNEKEKRKKS